MHTRRGRGRGGHLVYPLRRLQIIGHKNAIKHKNRGPPISWFHEKFILKIY
jgi:hypothetical protein